MSKSADSDIIAAIERYEADARRGSLAEDREEATDHYLGRPYGDEVEGRSQVVMRDVADTIEWIKPSLLKVFCAGDEVVRFDPVGPEDEGAAQQETDYCNHVVMQKNNGFLIFHDWFHDALLHKNGYVCVRPIKKTKNSREVYRGLSDDEFTALMQSEGIELLEHSEQQAVDPTTQDAMAAAQGMPPPQPVTYHDAVVRKVKEYTCLQVLNVPPERVLFQRCWSPLTFDDCPFVEVIDHKTISQLREEGFEVEDSVSDAAGYEDDEWQEQARRQPEDGADERDDDAPGPNRSVRVRYIWIRHDSDGDGIAELHSMVVVGKTILEDEEDDVVPVAAITPARLPHEHVGQSVDDMVSDLQRIRTILVRGFLDGMYLSMHGRNAIDVTRVNLDDMLVTRPGGIVRVQGDPTSAIMPMIQPMNGTPVLQAVEYIDGVREARTGVTRYNQGMDADSLNKMLDVHTRVPLADGSAKLLKDIIDGDRIIGSDGRAVTVLRAHEIHEPARAYRMVFGSGEEVIAGGEHLWTVQDERAKRWTGDTDSLYAYRESHACDLYIPRVQRPEFEQSEILPLDPYILGYWLGDGHSWSARITTMDEPVVERFKRWCMEMGYTFATDKSQNSGQATTYSISGGFMTTLRAMDLMKRDQAEARFKHIPEQYLRASYSQRMELLRGLMDSDGCHHSGALCVFSQKSGRLADDVFRLIETLGGWPNISAVDPGDSGKPGQAYQNITFHLFDNPFWLPRKADKWRAPKRNVETQPIRLIEPVDIRPMRCLTVDAADGLFCVGHRFTVTHNTAHGINSIMTASQQRIELIARMFAESGVRQLMLIIHAMSIKHGRQAEMIKLRGKWIPIDPRGWHDRTDVTVAVGIGTGNKDQMLQHLFMILQEQKQGLAAGLTDPTKIHNTLSRITQNAGFKQAEEFWTDPSAQGQKPPQPPPPEVQVEQMRQQGEAQKTQAQLQADQQKTQATMQAEQQAAQAANQQALQVELLKLEYQRQKDALDRQSEIEKAQIAASAQIEVARMRGEQATAQARERNAGRGDANGGMQ